MSKSHGSSAECVPDISGCIVIIQIKIHDINANYCSNQPNLVSCLMILEHSSNRDGNTIEFSLMFKSENC